MNRRFLRLVTMSAVVTAMTGSTFLDTTATAEAKQHKAYGSTIEINAPAPIVFEAIQKQRNSTSEHRQLVSYNGKVAVIKEHMEGVPIYGTVECTWEETEEPYKRIDYKMLNSTKFKEGYGSWVLTPSTDGKCTTLEFSSYTDAGLMVPFAGELTKMQSVKSAKLRLENIKQMAEEMEKGLAAKEKEQDSEKVK